MALPRLQLFEFNDASWAPAALRETLTEALSRAIRWGKLTDGLLDPLAPDEVRDLVAYLRHPVQVPLP